ncbi:MAG TPA: hypothetical protein VMH05_16530 [Bryobacteraceae bacterium]|nr:hypothetical protein [Bryobacteraceae bacterium]
MKAFLLVLASILFCLVVFEAGLRLFTGFGSHRTGSAIVSDQPVGLEEVAHYVDQIATAPGTDRRWFTENPPPLPNRKQPTPEQVARFNDYKQRGVFADQADYIWNRYYVEGTRCAPDNLFKNYPEKVLAFDPPTLTPHPFYRFPPDTTGVGGLVTNQFGMRGPPLTLAKPARTIRLAFIGSSTTVDYHNFAFSYPEYVTYWLNRFAESNRLNVHFEMLNAGREGINSTDIAAIVRDELLALDPDLAIYNGGANQFPSANQLVSPRIPPRSKIDPNDPIARHVVPEFLRTHFAVGDLIDRASNGFSAVGEPRKPAYRLRWPHGVDEQNPDVDRANLPLQLPVIVKDLDSIRASLKTIGSELMVCSFEWFASDTIALSPVRHRFIYEQLNTILWPLRYSDIRRLAIFHNRVLQRYAASRGLAFLDVAKQIPEDPNLFADAIHMTEAGDRLKAWIVFQQMAPLLRRKIDNGELPRPADSHPVPPAPSLASFEMPARCEVPRGPFTSVAGAVSLDAIVRHNGAVIEKGPPVKITTSAEHGAYAAELALRLPKSFSGQPLIHLRGQVLMGEVTLGIIDDQSGDYQVQRSVAASSKPVDIYVPILFPSRATKLIIRNTGVGNAPSEMVIQAASLVLRP